MRCIVASVVGTNVDKGTPTEVVLLLSKKSTDGMSGNPGDVGS